MASYSDGNHAVFSPVSVIINSNLDLVIHAVMTLTYLSHHGQSEKEGGDAVDSAQYGRPLTHSQYLRKLVHYSSAYALGC